MQPSCQPHECPPPDCVSLISPAESLSNTGMEQSTDIEQRLTDLEIKASFTEDLVEHLNQTVFRQQEQIDTLLREILQLRQQGADNTAGGPRSLRDELPPHY